MVRCHDAAASFLVGKVRDEVFAYFHAVTIKRHNSMQNWLFGLPGWILCEQFNLCQRKWWSCSWLCSSPVSPFLGLGEFDSPCMAHAFFHEYFSNYCQGLLRTFLKICTTFYAHLPFLCCEIASGQMHDSKKKKDIKISMSTQLREILYTDSQDMLVLSSAVVSRYNKCCTDGSTSPGNYRYPS
jgi:hypothetical protein